jgi:formylglycine-generating enzyme required for sulfatase activity
MRTNWLITGSLLLAAGLPLALPRAASEAEDPQVKALIERLDHEEFAERERASDELERLGEQALPGLRQALESDVFEIRWRAQRLLLAPSRKSKATGLALVLIRAGEFQMGSPDNEDGRRHDERQHRTRISRPFYVGAYEVTQEEYRHVMKTSPSWFAKTGGGSARVGDVDTARFPVERVSWFDAATFCNELSRLDHFEPYYVLEEVVREGETITSAEVTIAGGHGYRLPTEAEWEFACRAGTATPFHFGSASNGHGANLKGVTIMGGYGGVIKGPNLERTTVVGSYQPNAWGLFDMHGNVAEWCGDWYGRDYYSDAPTGDPPGPREGQQRVQRGGSWLVGEASCRSASRIGQPPGERKDFAGFRVARDP